MQHLRGPQPLPKMEPCQYCRKEVTPAGQLHCSRTQGCFPAPLCRKTNKTTALRVGCRDPGHCEEWSLSTQAAECDCLELPSSPLKHVGYCSHSFLSPWCLVSK